MPLIERASRLNFFPRRLYIIERRCHGSEVKKCRLRVYAMDRTCVVIWAWPFLS